VQELFKAEFGRFESNKFWAAWLWWDQHYNWTDSTFISIQFGSFTDDLKKLLERLVGIANKAITAAQTISTA
jgi:hypothetical protein